jgi:hypothetical protein
MDQLYGHSNKRRPIENRHAVSIPTTSGRKLRPIHRSLLMETQCQSDRILRDHFHRHGRQHSSCDKHSSNGHSSRQGGAGPAGRWVERRVRGRLERWLSLVRHISRNLQQHVATPDRWSPWSRNVSRSLDNQSASKSRAHEEKTEPRIAKGLSSYQTSQIGSSEQESAIGDAALLIGAIEGPDSLPGQSTLTATLQPLQYW